MKPKVYLETSVIGYYASKPSRDLITAANQQVTVEWWDKYLPKFDAYISPLVYDEISKGDANASKQRIEIVTGIQELEITPKVLSLAKTYYEILQIPEKAKADATHLALATIHSIDYLVSWNCVHIVGGRVRKIIENYNIINGLFLTTLCTPQELMED
ncbi:MAG: type II toxin-antitoxin system VapC family toxin [Candidatus Kapabacteria bacterium]|nr:type II toxin-antitoxin system VapC family toxin [Candidatus Kapabacteria bacterium]